MFFSLAMTLGSFETQDIKGPLRQSDAPVTPELAPCQFQSGAVLVKRKADLPPEILLELGRLFASIGGIAEASQFFEASDAPTTTAPKARFIRGYQVGETWFVWFERGGIGISGHTVAFVPTLDQSSGKTNLRAAPGSHFQGDLCAGSKAFIAGARSAS